MFCIPEIFNNNDKIIYLDLDILVFNDLTELYNTNMDNHYTSGVLSLAHYLQEEHFCKHIPLPNLLNYINCGVQVMNIKKMREDNLYEQWIELIGSYSDSVNQHIINRTCYDKIKLIPFKWNVTQTNEEIYKNGTALISMTQTELDEAYNNPAIYHYTNIWKPWKYRDVKYSIIWRRYYNKTLYKNILLNLAMRCEENKFH